jgi:hypothetical protein
MASTLVLAVVLVLAAASRAGDPMQARVNVRGREIDDAWHRQKRVDREASEAKPTSKVGWAVFIGLFITLQVRKSCGCASSGATAMQPIDFVFRRQRPTNHFLENADGTTVELGSYRGSPCDERELSSTAYT